jgi:uncharacterized glyoxalase superfamily protein PhnB
MIIVKATKDSEAGVMPEEALLAEMAEYHEELANAGALLDASGLQPSSKGWRIIYSGKERTLVDGPFTEAKELVAGYTIIQAGSKDEAVEWTRRFPNPAGEDKKAEIEVRQLFELEDFGQSEEIERFRKIGLDTGTGSCAMHSCDEIPQKGGTTMSSQQVQAIPDGMHTVTPHLICAGAAEAIDFYKKAFGAVEMGRLPGPRGKLLHAMIRIGDSTIMLVDEWPDCGALGPKSLKGSPVTLHLYVEDVDSFVKRAVEVGAKITMPVENMFWGDRYGQIEDPFGHHWSIATHIREVSPEEMELAARTACG